MRKYLIYWTSCKVCLSLPKLTIQLGRFQWSGRLIMHRVVFETYMYFCIYIYFSYRKIWCFEVHLLLLFLWCSLFMIFKFICFHVFFIHVIAKFQEDIFIWLTAYKIPKLFLLKTLVGSDETRLNQCFSIKHFCPFSEQLQFTCNT